MTWTDTFWQLVWDYRAYGVIMLAFLTFMLLLTGVSLVFGTRGTAAYRLSVLNLVCILLAGGLTAAFVGYSYRRRDSL